MRAASTAPYGASEAKNGCGVREALLQTRLSPACATLCMQLRTQLIQTDLRMVLEATSHAPLGFLINAGA